MTEDLIKTLKAIEIFQTLTEEMLQSLSEKFQTILLEPGEVLFNKGELGDSFYIVQKGQLKIVSADNEGAEVVLNQVSDGGIIGEMALIDQGPRSAGVIAVNATSLLKLSSEDFMKTIKDHPEIAMMISRNLTQRLRRSTIQIENAVPNEVLEERVEARTAEITRDNQKLKEMATIDPLTKIFNRRHFFEVAQQEIVKSRRHGTPTAAIMLDLDHFKHINDRYGHLAGDRVLQAAAGFIQDNIREIDILARYGGEEFVVLLPNTSLPEAKEIAERVCAVIEAESVQMDETVIPITASLGVAGFKDLAGVEIEMLLDKADHALYEAKNTGRNRVVAWEE